MQAFLLLGGLVPLAAMIVVVFAAARIGLPAEHAPKTQRH
jgi:hypothetical protein